MLLPVGRKTTNQQEIVETLDFTVTMMLCHKLHQGDKEKLKACAGKLAARFTESFSRDIALEAFFSDSPTSIINRCIEMLNKSASKQDVLKLVLNGK